MKPVFVFCLSFLFLLPSFGQKDSALRKSDRKKNIELQTSFGNIVIKLSDATPLHKDNFIRLVKTGYYNGVLFHRVIQNFMIQSGDPKSITAEKGIPLGSGGPGYTIPAEFRPDLFHKKGVVAAARMGDNVNPKKESSGSQFYIVQGKTFTDEQLDSIEQVRLNGRKLPMAHREYYKTIGGTPQLDQNYTVFGMVISGLEVVDSIAATATSKGPDKDRPIENVRIINAKLVNRKLFN